MKAVLIELFPIIFRRSFVQNFQNFLQCAGFVHLLHGGKFTGQATGRGFENLPFGIALFRLVVGTEKIAGRSEEHTSELQSLMSISYAVFCLKKKNTKLPTPLN